MFNSLGLLTIPTHGQDATLRPLPKARLSALFQKAKGSLLPSDANITVTPHQYFVLSGAGVPDLAMVPLLYDSDAPAKLTEPDVCGVIFESRDQPAYFVQVIGVFVLPGLMRDNCGGVIATGRALDAGPRPRLIVSVEGISGHGDEYPLPTLLVWVASARKYALDASTSDWLAHQDRSDTVLQVRRLLKMRH